MKVLIINSILYTAENDDIPKVESIKDTMIYTLCLGFLKNGDTPVLVAADPYKPIKEENYPFEVLWFPCAFQKVCKPRCLPYLKGLSKYLRQHGQEYDYIISSEVFSLLTFSAALFVRDKLLIWHELGAHNHLMRKIPSKIWYNVVTRIVMKNIPVIPRSERAAEFIKQYCDNVLPIRIDHGVNLDKIPYKQQKENYFVVLSQLIERKHIDGIINRFSLFRKSDHNEYRLKIIGDGDMREKLQELAKQLGEEENITFFGKLNHDTLMPVLAGAKALLINTSKDNSMVSIVESIAAGTPVITTSIPFNAVYIRENSLGIVKDDWGVEELNTVCANNDLYVKNCIEYREKLSNEYMAEMFDQAGGKLSIYF